MVTGDIGGRLRRAREERGLSLHDAARRTKLSIRVLQALERNDFSSLPGGMFRKAYLRTLAVEVGLSPNEVAADYCAQFEPPIESPATINRRADLDDEVLKQLTPSPRRSILTLAALVASATAWFMLQSAFGDPQLPVPDATSGFGAVRIPPPAGHALTSDGPRHAATSSIALAGDNRSAPLSIEIHATGWCWVAAETDGARVIDRLVEPGERLFLDGHRVISLRLGDAGAVTLSINHGANRSFGRHGQVVEFELTPDNVGALRAGGVEAAAEGTPY